MGTTDVVKIRPGTLIGRYRIVRVLRKSGDDALVDARDENELDMVALKLVMTRLDESTARDGVLAMAAKIENLRNPHLLPVREHGVHGYMGYQRFAPFTAELLAVAMESGDKFTPTECLRIANDIATGLQALHEAGLTHGDISPENICLARHNRARLFGSSLYGVLNPPGTASDTDVRANHPYAAPERRRHGSSPGGDLYSLGLVLYELLTGRQAASTTAGYNPGDRDSLTPRPPAPFKSVAPHLPRPLEILTFSLLQSKPEDRCHSAAEFRARIRQIVHAAQRKTTPHKPN